LDEDVGFHDRSDESTDYRMRKLPLSRIGRPRSRQRFRSDSTFSDAETRMQQACENRRCPMLLAPFALTDPVASSNAPRARIRSRKAARKVPAWLVAWAVLGALAVILVPALRGGDFGGLTVPFWLLVAPLIDIAWLTRERWLGRFRIFKSAAKPQGRSAIRRRR
jgi:hypothetical protein